MADVILAAVVVVGTALVTVAIVSFLRLFQWHGYELVSDNEPRSNETPPAHDHPPVDLPREDR